jgi:hypothetical protein
VAYQLDITEKPTYLHVVVTGDNCRETVSRYIDEIVRECAARNCPRVLIEEHLQGPRLGTIDVFSLAAAGSMRYMGMIKSMAYVDSNAVGDTMNFAENVAVNRAFPVKVFATVAAAERWLLGAAPRVAQSATAGAPSKPGC